MKEFYFLFRRVEGAFQSLQKECKALHSPLANEQR